jgi:hypothetical protein
MSMSRETCDGTVTVSSSVPNTLWILRTRTCTQFTITIGRQGRSSVVGLRSTDTCTSWHRSHGSRDLMDLWGLELLISEVSVDNWMARVKIGTGTNAAASCTVPRYSTVSTVHITTHTLSTHHHFHFSTPWT